MRKNRLKIIILVGFGFAMALSGRIGHADPVPTEEYVYITHEKIQKDADLLCTDNNQDAAVETLCAGPFKTCREAYETAIKKWFIANDCEESESQLYTCSQGKFLEYTKMLLWIQNNHIDNLTKDAHQCISAAAMVEYSVGCC